MLSDALKEYKAGEEGVDISEDLLRVLAYGCIKASHAGMFIAFTKTLQRRNLLNEIIKGEERFPADPRERDVLYFLTQSFRARLIHDLPKNKKKLSNETQFLAHRAKALIKDLAQINQEFAQMVVSDDEGEVLPEWFMVEVVRDLPRLVPEMKDKG